MAQSVAIAAECVATSWSFARRLELAARARAWFIDCGSANGGADSRRGRRTCLGSGDLPGSSNFRGLGRGDEDDGFAGDFDPDLVAEAEDSGFAGGGELDLHRGLGADLDLVEVAGALEHAERDLPGDAWATRHRGLGHREGL